MADVEVQIVPATPEQMPVDPTLATRRPRKVYGGMWGPLEMGAVAAGALTLVAAIALYLVFVAPSNREVLRNRSQADVLEAELISAKAKYGDITNTNEQVAKLMVSANDFETRFLPAGSNGRTSLYERLNGLIAAYGLVNTTGPDYQPLEAIDKSVNNNQSEQERGRERFRSLFPGVYVTTTVEGSYQNLRRFIREIETGNEFVIISSIELAPSDAEQKPDLTKPPVQNASLSNPIGGGNPGVDANGFPLNPNANPAAQPQTLAQRNRGKTHGEIVALRLEMAAYFRRTNFVPMTPSEETK